MIFLLTFYVSDYAEAHMPNRYTTALTVNCTPYGGGDSDNDGICNSWEISGPTGKLSIPGDLIAGGPNTPYELLPSQEAGTVRAAPDPNKPDIYLEIDCYTGYCPSITVIDDIKAAFESADGIAGNGNINLHVQLDEQDIVCATHDSYLSDNTNCRQTRMTSATNTFKGFDQIKAAHFGSLTERCTTPGIDCTENAWWSAEGHKQKMTVFHYALFVKQQFEDPSSSGVSEQWGNDIMVSLGSFTGGVGSIDEQEGTLMHELGHNLDLDHGGPRKLAANPAENLSAHYGINCKPNYLSVMSYSRQMRNLVTDRDLDFSRMAIGPNPTGDTLAENSLDENAGIAPYTTPETVVYNSAGVRYTTTGSSFVDWNVITTGTVQENINGLSGCTNSAGYQTLRSFADWPNLWFKFRDDATDYADSITKEIVIDQRLSRVDAIESMLFKLPDDAYIGDPKDAKLVISQTLNDARESIKQDKFAEAIRSLTKINKMLNDEVVRKIANENMMKEREQLPQGVLLTVTDHLTDTIKSLRFAAKFVPNEVFKARFSEGSPRQQESLGVPPDQITCNKKGSVLFLNDLDDTPYCINTKIDKFGKDPWFAATRIS